MSSGSFAKREREKTKRERADRKREKRETRRSDTPEPSSAAPPMRTQAEVIAELQALHDAHDDGRVSFDDFESTKADLLAQLQV